MKVAVLAIGNEVLCGKVVDTNGAFISREIDLIGGRVTYKGSVQDTLDDIMLGLRQAYEHADVVITIGGLGPTVDDLTREAVAKFFDEELLYSEEVFQEISGHFFRMNLEVPDSNKQQAYYFKTGSVLKNGKGTAPGLSLKKDGKVVFLLPGPPHELQKMFKESVLPVVTEMIDEPIVMRSYRLLGIGESPAEAKVVHLYEKYPKLTIAPYCMPAIIDYMVKTSQHNEAELDLFEKEFLAILGEYHVGSTDVDLNVRVVELLQEKKLTLATAESCTGGMLASTFIDVPGVSSLFIEGVVAYGNEAKINRIGVDKELIAKHGAVSEEVARDMAVKLQKLTKADVTISTTGIAGPNGGTDEKPVGTVYMTICIGEEEQTWHYTFVGDRNRIRMRVVNQALYTLYRLLIKG